MADKVAFRKLAVSLGARALPVVREALDHAAANPTHNPILTVEAHEEDGQRVGWRCYGPDSTDGWSAPPTCAHGGDI